MCNMTYLQVTPVPKPQEVVQNSESTVAPAEATKQSSNSTPVAPPPKVDFATDLFDMLSMDGPSESGSEDTSPNDDLWAGFQCMSQDFPLIFYHSPSQFFLPPLSCLHFFNVLLAPLDF